MIYETETRIFENLYLYSGKQKRNPYPDKWMDQFYESLTPEEQAKFSIRYKKGVSKDKPTASMFIEKPKLQTTLETASPEEIQVVKEKNKEEELAIAMKRNSIDLIKEMEIWLGTINSTNSRRTYLSRITVHFLKYCKEYDFIPVMFLPNDARMFVNWLIANEKSNSLVRSIISACKKLFTYLWENHEIPIHTNPFGLKSLLPPKKRVKDLIIPDKEDIDRILDDTQKYPIIHTAIKLMVNHGMRIGAFQKMKISGNKAVTESKGKKQNFMFNDEEITLLKVLPPNELKTEQLGNRIFYYLKQACEKGVTKAKYSAHDFRHYFATDFYEKNKDTLDDKYIIRKLSKKLGHSDTPQTKVYLESLNTESL